LGGGKRGGIKREKSRNRSLPSWGKRELRKGGILGLYGAFLNGVATKSVVHLAKKGAADKTKKTGEGREGSKPENEVESIS